MRGVLDRGGRLTMWLAVEPRWEEFNAGAPIHLSPKGL
jgi:hypothetical protein